MADLPMPRHRTAAASSVDHARAIIEAHRHGKPPPSAALAWAATALELHLHVGVSLPLALGLASCHGGGVAAERRRQRDDLLREIARRWFPELCPAPAAVAITTAIARQARAQGRVTDDRTRALEILARCDPPLPSARQIRRILAIHPVEMATAGR
jgi:hypothetical protein